jgi:hypothetical protein
MYAPIEYVLWLYVMLLKMLEVDARVMNNTETHPVPECDSDAWAEICLVHMIHNRVHIRIAATCINVGLPSCVSKRLCSLVRKRR